jgi:phage gp37-like protein
MSLARFPAAQFEDGMLQRIKDAVAQGVLGYQLRQVETYKGQLNGGPKRVAELIREVPAVWVCFETARRDDASDLWLGTFSAVCVARNARNEAAARRGTIGQGGSDVGAYQIGKDVCGLLEEQAFGISDARAMRCLQFDAPFNAEFEQTRAAIVVLTFQAAWDPNGYTGPAGDTAAQLEGEPNARGLGAFATFNVDWDIPPFTNPTPAIPVTDPTKKDATDIVTLPTE